jgi:magnesium-transporting ATPase (P-type)
MIQIFGEIKLPTNFLYGGIEATGGQPGGLIQFLNNIVRLLIVVAGLFAFFNLILAGYGFLSSGNDPKKMGDAWAKIWQSMMGLLFIVGSFVLAAIFGWLLFGNPGAILNPKIYGPGSP